MNGFLDEDYALIKLLWMIPEQVENFQNNVIYKQINIIFVCRA